MIAPGLRELFDAARALPAEDRARFLGVECADPQLRAQVLRLLEVADRPETDWSARTPAQWLQALESETSPPRDCAGERFGPFQIEAALGQGGSAVVYRARRSVEGIDQTVALKVLRHGVAAPGARQQFDRERAALARLQHPNIARLIDAGITPEGDAWIALEYVQGVPVLEHARARALDARGRIALVLRIARVVAAAHRGLVVHRDLKPGNVLVMPDGEIKLLDFGIAKLIEPNDDTQLETLTQFRAFTPAYAAPEQREGGPITTATDVYALGVLLEEMLTGRRAMASSRSARSNRAAPPPADGGRDLHQDPGGVFSHAPLTGDIARIVRKATAEDAEQRYEGAAAFADDLQRLLDGLPVLAHPPSRAYLLRKFIVRHSGGVAVAAVLASGLLVALSLALWQGGIARAEANRARFVSEFLIGLFRAAEDRLPRNERPTPEILVEAARESLASETRLDSATRAELAMTLAEVSRLGARYDAAASLLSDARRELSGLPRTDARVRRLVLAEARVQQQRGNDREALASLDHLRAHAGDPLPLQLEALAIEASALEALGELRDATGAAKRRHQLAAAAWGESHPETQRAHLAYGVLLGTAEQFPESLAIIEPGLARWRSTGLPLDRDYMAAAMAAAGVMRALGRLDEALDHSTRLLDLQRSIYDGPHDVIALTLRGQARILEGAGRTEDAIRTHRESLRMMAQVLGESHADLVGGHTALGVTLAGAMRLEEAEAAYRRALSICDLESRASVACARARANLGMTLYRQRRFDDAEREIRAALERYRDVHGETHLNIAVSLSMLANVAAAVGRAPEAIGQSGQALAIMQRIGMADTRDALLMRNTLAVSLWRAERHAEALVEIDRSIAGFDRLHPGQSVRRAMMRIQRAQILASLGREDEARRAAEEAIAIGAPPSDLPPKTRQLMREFSGRPDLFAELDPPP